MAAFISLANNAGEGKKNGITKTSLLPGGDFI
ncbi:hypothetical protein GA8_13645 [Geobacillus sp. A8]|nr:hypothetical protein GA8_13645 [Geobacillus sp. A8]